VRGCMEECCCDGGVGYMSSLLKRLKVNGSDNFNEFEEAD